jgi:hypothetical protein
MNTLSKKPDRDPRGRRPRVWAIGALLATALTLALAQGAHTALAGKPAAAPPQPPTPTGPAEGSTFDALPVFSWGAVAGAERYEFEIAADAGFNSPVLGSNFDSFLTRNTRATLKKVIPNGTYWWHVRSVGPDGAVSAWSPGRSFRKEWAASPALSAPGNGATITFPAQTFKLSWAPVPGAATYLVTVAFDQSLGSVVWGGGPVETQATAFTLSSPLAPDKTYYWAVTPLDAAGNRGARSAVWSFTWRWPSTTVARVTDVAVEPEIYDHRFSWDPVPGAAGYEVEVNPSSDFAPGSKVCCPVNFITRLTTIGTSYSPAVVLPNNNSYYWRVRAVDPSGNAGEWNYGSQFLKGFDTALPSVKGLRMLDDPRESDPSLQTAGFETDTPIVVWDPVPGASSYEVEVTRFNAGCQWSAREEHWKSRTAAPAWTPLGSGWNSIKPFESSRAVSFDIPEPVPGHEYCVRVTALDRPSDIPSPYIRSAETYLPDENTPAFTWLGMPAGGECSPSCSLGALGRDDYVLPARGVTTARMPFFRWRPLAGYQSYFVLVSTDPQFSTVIDYAFTHIPAYAPRTGLGPRSYPDETTLYYWAVLPATGDNGSGVTTAPRFSAPADFHKRSAPPSLIAPADTTVFSGAPTFHWAPTEAARRYRLQVSQDPTFSNLIVEDVVTDSTSYTSSETYPADTDLYWRVRADAEDITVPTSVALTWSRTGRFRKTLAAPAPDPTNPTSGDAVPTWQWAPVPGAVSYDFHLEFPNGTARDFKEIPSNAGTPTLLKGTGVWHWQVRANFPQVGSTIVRPGPWSIRQAFTRTIREPANAAHDVSSNHILFTWSPKLGAQNYRVQISTRADFSVMVENSSTDNTSYAPTLMLPAYLQGGTFYWRVAAADDIVANVGDFTAARSFTLPARVAPTPPPPARRMASRITASVTKTARAVKVRGTVSPRHAGKKVTVKLFRKRNARFVRVAWKTVTLTRLSGYTARFARPRRGYCKATARFLGDADHLPSVRTVSFRC